MKRTLSLFAAVLTLAGGLSATSQAASAQTTILLNRGIIPCPYNYCLTAGKTIPVNSPSTLIRVQNVTITVKPTAPATNTSKTGSAYQQTTLTSQQIRDMQIKLAFLGYLVTVNGQYDNATRQAVMLFQQRTTGTYNGVADAKTYQAIQQAYDQKMALLRNPGTAQPVTPAPAAPKPSTPANPQPNPTTPTAPAQPGQAAPSVLTAEEQAMLNLINQERTRNGLKPLTADPLLTQVARLKAQDMVKNGYFSHTSPTYGSPFQMMKSFGVTYQAAAENIAQAASVTRAHQLFMNSSGHRANIMNGAYTHAGIGIVAGGRSGKTFVQMFIQK